jgi:hypothetical protein
MFDITVTTMVVVGKKKVNLEKSLLVVVVLI